MSGSTPLLMKPFVALWMLVSFVFELSLRTLAVIAGIALTIIGILLSMTIVALPFGVPLAFLGLVLIVKSFM